MPKGNKSKEELEEENQTLQKELNALKNEKAGSDKKNEELRRIHLRQENRAKQLCKDINELTADNETLCDAVVALKTTNSTLRNNITAMDMNVAEWEKYASEGRDELAQLNLYTDGLEERLERQRAKIKELEARLTDVQERNEDLEDRLVAKKIKAQALKAEYDELERSNKALWTTINYLDEVIDEDQAEVMRLRQGVLVLKEHWESSMQE
ncbi:unnamed protein product [Aureobasidium uvarum]|uniref:Uncharacterized protein n=1 Tax=Aureobasidium uvarum TaxID=2773716 RepID=A0A9N8KJT5_9PEZI|nr:unnamed protein product [Aureobasidium uvarum]